MPTKHNTGLKSQIILIKGAGEKASAVAHYLYRTGLRKIVMTDLLPPRAERRGVAFCEAIVDGKKEVCGVISTKAEPSIESINHSWAEGKIPVIPDPESMTLQLVKPDIFIDGVMAKRNTGTTIQDAPLVIALGPGFVAGKDVHFVVETNPASRYLGRVILEGRADEDTGRPTSVMGFTAERLLKAPADGKLVSVKRIGDKVSRDETIAYVNSAPLHAQIPGCVWGLVRDGIILSKRQKIGDIDPRGKRELCFEITPEAKAIAAGVIEGIIRFQNV